jgi:hypothetical protein
MSSFGRLDFVYSPAADVEAELRYFVDVLGARLVFAVAAMGRRVAMVELGEGSPQVLLAGHLEGKRPVLVYRVADLDTAVDELRSRGCECGPVFEIPHGPVCPLVTPGGHRIAVYQRTRPQAAEHFEGRRDF